MLQHVEEKDKEVSYAHICFLKEKNKKKIIVSVMFLK